MTQFLSLADSSDEDEDAHGAQQWDSNGDPYLLPASPAARRHLKREALLEPVGPCELRAAKRARHDALRTAGLARVRGGARLSIGGGVATDRGR